MNPNPLKMQLDRAQMESLCILIGIEEQRMHETIHQMRGQDYLVYKVISDLQRRFQDKVQHWHPANKQYTITLDKGEAWVMLYHFNNRIEEYHPVKQILGSFHQALI